MMLTDLKRLKIINTKVDQIPFEAEGIDLIGNGKFKMKT